jgi:hypothetical protein
MTQQKYNLDFEQAIIGPEGWAENAGWILTYQSAYDTTREYTGCTWQYCPAGVGIAAGSYTDKPTAPTEDNQAIRRTEDGSTWEIVPDYRGQTAYSTETGQPETVSEMGELPDTLTLLAPQTPFDVWDGTQWVTDKDAERAAKIAEVKAELQQLEQEADDTIRRLERVIKNAPTDEEKALLEAWEKYSADLYRLKPEDWPDIKLPVKPS